MEENPLVVVLGGGELGSAVAAYLWQDGLAVGIALDGVESHLRRPICFAEAQLLGNKQIGEATAQLISPEHLEAVPQATLSEQYRQAIGNMILDRQIPVWNAQDTLEMFPELEISVLIKTLPHFSFAVSREWARLTIGFLPHHRPGEDCHLAVETRMNYLMGEVALTDPPERPTHDLKFFRKNFATIPAPLEGVFVTYKEIGEAIHRNEPIGTINEIEIRSPYEGQIWGMLHSGRFVKPHQELALIFEGMGGNLYANFGFEHRAVAGAVLMEVLRFLKQD